MKKYIITAIIMALVCATIITVDATEINSGSTRDYINSSLYPATGIVITIAHGSEYEDITIEHANRNRFQFTAPATDCWELGDLASCIMDSNGTPDSVYDDKVLSAWYCGSPDQFTSIIH